MMKTKALALSVIAGAAALLSAQSFAQDTLFKADFGGDKPLEGWSQSAFTSVVNEGPDGGACVKFSIPKPEEGSPFAKSAMISRKLSGDDLKGKKIVVEAKLKAENLLEAEKPYLGPKVMLYFVSGDKKSWLDQKKQSGTYGWTPVSFTADVPQDAKDFSITIGIQSSAGTLWIDDLVIKEAAK